MLDAKLRDLIEKRRAATPGPWGVGAHGAQLVAQVGPFEVSTDSESRYDDLGKADAAFIVEAADFPFEELAAERERLREALERTLGNFERVLASKPVRDATETIAEARAALQEVTE